jgi:hypothetical protein
MKTESALTIKNPNTSRDHFIQIKKIYKAGLRLVGQSSFLMVLEVGIRTSTGAQTYKFVNKYLNTGHALHSNSDCQC